MKAGVKIIIYKPICYQPTLCINKFWNDEFIFAPYLFVLLILAKLLEKKDLMGKYSLATYNSSPLSTHTNHILFNN